MPQENSPVVLQDDAVQLDIADGRTIYEIKKQWKVEIFCDEGNFVLTWIDSDGNDITGSENDQLALGAGENYVYDPGLDVPAADMAVEATADSSIYDILIERNSLTG